MFLSLVLFTFLSLIFRPGHISLACSESRGLVCSFGRGFRVWGLFSGSRFRDKVSLPMALVPFLGCVSFPGSECRARLLGGCARDTGKLIYWLDLCVSLTKASVFVKTKGDSVEKMSP